MSPGMQHSPPHPKRSQNTSGYGKANLHSVESLPTPWRYIGGHIHTVQERRDRQMKQSGRGGPLRSLQRLRSSPTNGGEGLAPLVGSKEIPVASRGRGAAAILIQHSLYQWRVGQGDHPTGLFVLHLCVSDPVQGSGSSLVSRIPL